MQTLGETREALTKDVMRNIEDIINKTKHEKYYILVHGKPFPDHRNVIKMKYLIMDRKPSMMLACMLFKVDNSSGKLTLEWSLAGDWPTLCVGKSEPVPETIASYERLDKSIKLCSNSFFEDSKMSSVAG